MVERLRFDKANNGSSKLGTSSLMMTGLVEKPPRLKAMSSMGVSGVSVLSGYVRTTERSADWVGTRKWQTIADMSVNVSIIAASVGFFLNMVAHPQWHVSPAEDKGEGKSSKEAEKLAEFVEDAIHDMTTPWQRVVRRAAMYRFNGFGLQEWIAKKRDDGKIGIKDVEPRPCFTIERWAIDDDGTVLGVWQRSPQTFELLGLPRGKLVYLVDDTYTDQPDGLGVYRMLGEPFNRLRQYLELEARAYERDMRGIPVGRAPVSIIKQLVKEGKLSQSEGEQQLQGIRDFITTQVRDKNTSILMDSLPYENQTADGLTIAGTQQWDVSLLSGGVSGLGDMATAIDRLQREMARIIGTEHLMMGDQGGNRALSQDKSRNLYLIANAVLANIADTMDHDLIDPLWSLNGFDPDLKPYFSTEDVAFKDAQQIAVALAQMATAGAVLQPDDPAIDDVRDLLGISKAPPPTPAQLGAMQGIPGAPGAPGAPGGPFGAKKPAQPPPNGAGGANGKVPGRGSPPAIDDAKQQQVAADNQEAKTTTKPKQPKQQPVKKDDDDDYDKYNENHDAAGRFTYGSGQSGTQMEFGTRALSPAGGELTSANDNISRSDASVGTKVKEWMQLSAREKLVEGMSGVKEISTNLVLGTLRETVVIAAVEATMHHLMPGLPHELTLPASAALTAVIGGLATKFGITEHGIKTGLKIGITKLIAARKEALAVGRAIRASRYEVADIASGRVLTKDDQDVGVFLLWKADAISADVDDAVLHYLNGLYNLVDAYQPKRDKAELDATDATVHVYQPHDAADMGKFNEHHDSAGRFSSGDGGGGSESGSESGSISEGHPGEGYSADAKVVEGKIYTSDVNDAVKALAENREVVLSQPDEVATLLDKLAAIGRDAVAKGEKAPTYDLCNVSVSGTNLFCAESLGIPRIDMPQLSGKPLPGSKADSLPKNKNGEVNLSEEFTKHCAALGKITDDTVDASHLRASQNELNGGKVAGIYGAMAAGTLPPGDRLFISKDNYIIDGHHRWAAAVTHEAAGTAGISTKIDVRRVDIDTVTMLDEAKKFAKDWGLPQMAKRRAKEGTVKSIAEIRAMMAEQRQIEPTLKWFVASGYRQANNLLRGMTLRKQEADHAEGEIIKLDAALASPYSRTPTDMLVYRGITPEFAKKLEEALKGDGMFGDLGYIIASVMARQTPYQMQIELPAGTAYLSLNKFLLNEIVLPHGGRLQAVAYHELPQNRVRVTARWLGS